MCGTWRKAAELNTAQS